MSAVILLILRVILAALLYAFLGWAIYVIWRDMKQQGELLAARQPTPLTLTTELDSPPLTRHFSTPEVILGREPSCAFPINDQTVSSRHARLSFHQNQWWLEDLASTNGTLLNNESVTTAVVITNGDMLRLGQVGVRVTIGESR